MSKNVEGKPYNYATSLEAQRNWGYVIGFFLIMELYSCTYSSKWLSVSLLCSCTDSIKYSALHDRNQWLQNTQQKKKTFT